MRNNTILLGVCFASAACMVIAACGGDSSTDSTSSGGTQNASGGSGEGGVTTSGGSGGTNPSGGTATATGGAGGQTAASGCAAYCETAVAAGCDVPSSEAECLATCNVLTNIEDCAEEVEETLRCQASATASCDAEGEVEFSGCETEEVVAFGCILTIEPSEELASSCDTYCEAVAEANCPNEDTEDCASSCPLIPVLAPACEDTWTAYVDCAGDSELTCDEEGEVESQECYSEGLSAFACLLTNMAGI